MSTPVASPGVGRIFAAAGAVVVNLSAGRTTAVTFSAASSTFRGVTGILAAVLAASVGSIAAGAPGPVAAQVRVDPAPTAGTATIEYIGHASFRITSPEGQRVLLDPFASQVWLGYDFPSGIEADAVVVTHPHYDHDAGEYRGRSWPWSSDVRVFRYPGEFEVGDVRVTGVRGRHVDPYGREFGQVNTIFVVETAGLRIGHVGDNGPLTAENFDQMGRVDVLMLPIDGEYHILDQQSIEDAINGLQPRIVVPMHYRIPELEPGDGPETLGPIGPWLEGRPGVRRLDGNVVQLGVEDLPTTRAIVVFQPHPRIARTR